MTVRLGFIGAGNMAQIHIKALSHLNNVEISGIYDVNSELAEQVAKSVGAKVHQDHYSVINSGDIDALFVCTPQFAREDIEETAAQKGIHLFVEKPLGLDLEIVRKKEKIIRETGIIHSAGYCLRYLDTVQKAKSYLSNKQIDMVMAYRFGGLYAPKWWRQLDRSGGLLVDTTTHQVDLIRYLADDIREVYARMERRAIQQADPDGTIYDVGTISFITETGIIGNISNTCLSPHYSRAEVEFFGRNFCVQINGMSLRIIDEHQDTTEVSRMDFYLQQDKSFIDAVESGSQDGILCNYSDALKTLEVTLAANQSTLEKNPIQL